MVLWWICDDCHLANPEVWVCPLPSTGNGNGDTTHTSRLTDVMNVFSLLVALTCMIPL